MAWEQATWSCGHTGTKQLRGPYAARRARLAHEASRICMACWLLRTWRASGDPRALREDRWELACAIAENNGNRIDGQPPADL